MAWIPFSGAVVSDFIWFGFFNAGRFWRAVDAGASGICVCLIPQPFVFTVIFSMTGWNRRALRPVLAGLLIAWLA